MGASKRIAELIVRDVARREGRPYVVGRGVGLTCHGL
jgi:hypothetical protein